MIRAILIFILLLLVYQALKIVIRSAVHSAQGKDERARLRGEEMVLDPECRTYVLKERAVVRSIHGVKQYFCSEECARKNEERGRS